MKIRADEHISPKIVRALHAVSLRPGWELTHVRDFHSARTADETWIPRFAAEGGQVILSADTKMLKRPHQLVAIQESKVIGVFLSSSWAESKRHEQAANLILYWPQIEKALETSKPSDCWRVPANLGKDEIQQIKVNYAKAAKASK